MQLICIKNDKLTEYHAGCKRKKIFYITTTKPYREIKLYNIKNVFKHRQQNNILWYSK